MKLSQQDKNFLLFVLNETGKANVINDVTAHLEKTDESINSYLLKAFKNKYNGDQDKAEREVLRYRSEYDKSLKLEIEEIKRKSDNLKPTEVKKTEPVSGVLKRITLGIVGFAILIGLAIFAKEIYTYYNSPKSYVIADDGVRIRRSKLITDTNIVAQVGFGDYVNVVEVDSLSTWCKVKKNNVTGFVASFHYLGSQSLLESLDSIYINYKKTPDNEWMNSSIKKAVYKYISDSSFLWCLKPVVNLNSPSNKRHSVIELPETKFGVVQFGNGHDQGMYHLVMLRSRARRDKSRALLLELSPSYEAHIIAEADLENASDCFFYQNSAFKYFIYDFTSHRFLTEILNQNGKPTFNTLETEKDL